MKASLKVSQFANPWVRRPILVVSLPFMLVLQVLAGAVGTVRAVGQLLRSFWARW